MARAKLTALKRAYLTYCLELGEIGRGPASEMIGGVPTFVRESRPSNPARTIPPPGMRHPNVYVPDVQRSADVITTIGHARCSAGPALIGLAGRDHCPLASAGVRARQ